MVPLAFCLVFAAPLPVTAAPAKKSPPTESVPPAPPAPKPSLLQKLNPFRKKDPPPPPAPAPAPPKNSKKSAPSKAVPAVPPPAPAKPAVPPKPQAAPPPSAPAEPKKPGFFSRLKAKLDRDPDALPAAEKPERPSDWKERWVVTEDSTAFYEFGPSQASGPDLRLPKGQILRLGKASRGWAHVELDGGRSGYIGTDQMRQAKEDDFAPPQIAVLPQLAAGSLPAPWSPGAVPPDQPDLPSIPGAENSQLLLPPLEYEGTELKKSSLLLPGAPALKPGDTLPNPAPEAVPSLKLEEATKAQATKTAPSPAEPAPAPAAEPPAEPTPVTPPNEPAPAAPAAEPPPAPSQPEPTPVPAIPPPSGPKPNP